jgi:hypothetical protein
MENYIIIADIILGLLLAFMLGFYISRTRECKRATKLSTKLSRIANLYKKETLGDDPQELKTIILHMMESNLTFLNAVNQNKDYDKANTGLSYRSH